MSPLHPDEVAIDAALVRALLDAQATPWSSLPLRPVAEHGTDHRLFRLGDELAVRMPVHPASAPEAAVAARWLPVLAPALPVAVPVPLFLGAPGCGYPFAWSVVPWLPGAPPPDGGAGCGAGLAAFVRALHAVAGPAGVDPRRPAGGQPAGHR